MIKGLNLAQCEGDQCILCGVLNGHEVLVAIFVDHGFILVVKNPRSFIRNLMRRR